MKNAIMLYITTLLVGIVIGVVLGFWIHKYEFPCSYSLHKVGMTKIQYGIARTCCGDTVCIPEGQEFYRYYYYNHVKKRKIKCRAVY